MINALAHTSIGWLAPLASAAPSTGFASWAPWIVLGFLMGSIPFGLIIGRAHGVDIRTLGSKNIGATNVGRVLGKRAGFLCFALDLLKGALPVAMAGLALGHLGSLTLAPSDGLWWMAVVVSAPLGHMFSPWVWLKGGKGVATGFGALLAYFPLLSIPALLALLVWTITVKATRYVSVASCLAALSIPLSASVFSVWLAARAAPDSATLADISTLGLREAWPRLAVSALLALLVCWKHRGNIARLRAGTEPRIGQRANYGP
jgi:glycerol-3-phosphate acyltransferase PlsY